MPIVNDENGRPYAVHLCKTDIAQNNNKFYDMELSNGWGAQEFAVKLINGRIGYRGVTNFKYFGDLERAKKFFNQKFTEKTALRWEERDNNPIPGKYVVVELTHTAKPEVKKEEPVVKEEPKEPAQPEKKTRGRKKKVVEEPEIKKEIEEEIEEIDEKVKDLMRCICDEDIHLGLLRQLKFNEEYGKPIDCLSPAQIETGYEILAKIEESIGARRPARTSTRNRAPLTALTALVGSLPAAPVIPETRLQLTNKYYSLIPHAFGFAIPPRIESLPQVQAERELLDALKGCLEAAQNKKDAENEDSKKDVYQRLYERLPCQLEQVSEDVKEKIGACLKMRGPTHLYNLSIIDAFKLKNPEDDVKKEEQEVPKKRPRRGRKAPEPNAEETSETITRLLWHGTRVTNVFSILMNGLVFPEGDRYGLMFGNGVYFANVPTKSANYCCPEASKRVFMLLCEVKVQNPLVLYQSEVNSDELIEKAGKDSVYAAGKHRPTGMVDIEGTLAFRDGLTEIPEQTALLYDEYVMFDKDRFNIKYVVEVNVEKMRRLPK